MSSNDDSNTPKAWRDIGQALGGFAKRVGRLVDDISETARLPETLRAPLDALARQRHQEEFEACAETLRASGEPSEWDPAIVGAALLCRLHARLIDQTFDPQLSATVEERLEQKEVAARPEAHLWAAWRALQASQPLDARDALRRATRRREALTRRQTDAFDDLCAIIETDAHLVSGYPQRAQRSIMARLARREAFEASELDLIFVERATQIWLSLDEIDLALELRLRLHGQQRRASQDAQRQAGPEDAADTSPGDDGPTEAAERLQRFERAGGRLEALWARVDTARGDLTAGRAWLEAHATTLEGDTPGWKRDTALRLALATGQLERGKALAVEALRLAPSDPDTLRNWSLAELSQDEIRPPWSQDPTRARAAIDGLWPRVEALVGWARREALREIAFVALHAGLWELANDRRLREAEEPTPEFTLLRLGALLQSPDAEALEHIASLLRDEEAHARGGPLRLPRVEGPHGPDELSPLRAAEDHESALSAHAHFIASLAFDALERPGRAHQALVDALIECPELEAARRRLVRSQAVEDTRRIETLLGEATRRLGKMPRELAGVSIEGIDAGLERVVAIRERLARPLTIAIMGEFSSGKSTFVNAWLGRQFAPMGALPTTCTINVFRHGGQGQARIHRRDGRIELVGKSDLLGFLDGLDEEAARSIRHVEIERGELGIGNASIVDTPGLNALDPYHEQVARDFLAEADAVVWIFSSTQGAAASERAMLEEMRGDGRRVLGILNKVDVLEPGEDRELMDYLRDKLGEVLVDVLPLSAQAALGWREALEGDASALGGPQDPMRPVDEALEREFLANARELKVEICRRELAEAVSEALEGLDAAADRLERSTPDLVVLELATLRTQLNEVVDALAQSWKQSADTLNRELMALGVYEPQRGANEGRPDEHDHRYFEKRLSRVAASALAACLFELRAGKLDDTLLDMVGERLVPWLNGYFEGLIDAGRLEHWVADMARAAADGEEPARNALNHHLDDMAQRAREELGRIENALLARLRAQLRRRAGRGVAEALGLRALGETQLRPLLVALDQERQQQS